MEEGGRNGEGSVIKQVLGMQQTSHTPYNIYITASFHMINIIIKYDLIFVAHSSHDFGKRKKHIIDGLFMLIQILIKVHTYLALLPIAINSCDFHCRIIAST